MSNDIVGKLYNEVIEGVISAAQPDFEDNGVDNQTINELRTIWQRKLSELNVAKMPWDVESESTENNSNGNASTTAAPSQTSQPSATNDNGNSNSNGSNDTTVKQEPNELASITANGGGLVLPGGNISQTDGANDDIIPLSTDQLEIIAKQQRIKDTNDNTNTNNTNDNKQITVNIIKQDDGQCVLQVDGADSGEDSDEEINSDLDDPEDELASGDEDDDDDQGMIMLCLYDKVQRVKNKWKYVLKDGISNINGKEYVFSKGSGESEW